ncbi:MAG TPA: hypothetical protein VFC78_19500 [Tepidisphaeraceae bacterium]|nr:hypothetical protein [Tepidisphaeraceae bacterium]
MTSEDIRSELQKSPFTPFRLHLVSGKTLDVFRSNAAEMLQNSVLIFQEPTQPREEVGYDIVALRNIERLEQLKESNAAHE